MKVQELVAYKFPNLFQKVNYFFYKDVFGPIWFSGIPLVFDFSYIWLFGSNDRTLQILKEFLS
jgi:hypothetical protein